jgi:hypothetical protein
MHRLTLHRAYCASFIHTLKDAEVFAEQQEVTVSENTEGVVKNSGELSQIVLDIQRKTPYHPRI